MDHIVIFLVLINLVLLQFYHDNRAMDITFHKDEEEKTEGDKEKVKDTTKREKALTLFINEVNLNDLPLVPREREALARSKTSINMSGFKKYGYFPLLLNGELIPVSVLLNKKTNFSKLQVGK